MRARPDLAVYLVTDPRLCAPRGVLDTAVAAVAGGATLVQLRDKEASDADLITLGLALKAALASTPARLIVNDRLAVARAIGAHGLHIGQSDGDPRAARAHLGDEAIIGLSVETVAMARAVDPELIDYLGVGPVFATTTKRDHAAPLGLRGLAAICAAAPGLPKVAIGGLRLAHATDVIRAGADGLAVVSAICAASDATAAAAALRDRVEQARRAPGPETT